MDGKKIPWPERETTETGKQYCGRLCRWAKMVAKGDVRDCNTCQSWVPVDDNALHCESCDGFWCEKCKEAGPSKEEVPCEKCPDFSKDHCFECFAEGKTDRCFCSNSDSWHSCCGRHARFCDKCDEFVCDGCEDIHADHCEGEEEEGDEE